MGKNASELPNINQIPAAPTITTVSVNDKPPKVRTLTIEAPAVTALGDGYCQRQVQLRLTEKQAKALRSIHLGLEEKNAQLEDERYVNSPLDAVRWMLENARSGNA